jgi:hypothetical protein
MQGHVGLLGILCSLWGALTSVAGISLLLLAAGALAPVLQPERPGLAFAAGMTAAGFAILGASALLWGGAHVWAGMLLRKRRPLGRILSLALAVINLLVLPFGTALGVYALWVLLKGEGRALFEQAPVSPAASR